MKRDQQVFAFKVDMTGIKRWAKWFAGAPKDWVYCRLNGPCLLLNDGRSVWM